MHNSRSFAALLLAGFAGCSPGSDPATASATADLSGALFTTTFDGSKVNGNIYASKLDVYLDGGPLHKASPASLPDGDYYYQVTDPSGKVLLSEDVVQCREIRIAGGLIVEVFRGPGGCVHVSSTDVTDGGLTVQLMPYADTPNPGGEYKAWITPVADYRGEFVNRFSKTDNFKVRLETPPPPPPPCDAPPPPPPPCDAPPPPPPPPPDACATPR